MLVPINCNRVYRYCLAVLGLLVACAPLPPEPVAIVVPKVEVSWLKQCEFIETPWLDLSRLVSQKGCATNLVRSSKGDVLDSDGNVLLASSDDILSRDKWLLGERPAAFQILSSTAQIDGSVRRGLRQLEANGVLLQGNSWMIESNHYRTILMSQTPFDRVSLASQLPRAASAIVNSISVPNLENSFVFEASASFDGVRCASSNGIGKQIGVPPYGYKNMYVDVKLQGLDVGTAPVRLVKHWLDFEGNSHRTILSMNRDQSCSRFHDTTFDEALTSAYYIEIDNVVVSSPLWYSPLKG